MINYVKSPFLRGKSSIFMGHGFYSYCGWLQNLAPPKGWWKHVETLQWEVFHLSTGAGFRNHPQYVTLPNGTRSETWEPQKSPVKGSPAPSSYWLVGGFHKWGYPKMDVL